MVLPGVIPAVVEGASILYHTFSSSSSSNCCRTCTIEIHNRHKHLEFRQPEYHLYSGVNQTPPSPLIRPEDKASCIFRKVYNSSYGTAGVIVYDIHYLKNETSPPPAQDTDEKEPKLVLMWSVPFIGATQHAIGIEKEALIPVPNGELFQKLYYGEEKWFQRQIAGECVKCEDTVYGLPLSVMGSISNDGHATWTIEIE